MAQGPIRYLLSKLLASSTFKGRIWNRWYRYIDTIIDDQPIWFLNYGYMADNGAVTLRPEDEPNRSSIQLYEAVTRPADLTGRDVLEVSCGRGGGIRYLSDYRRTRSVVGLDRIERAVAFCRRAHGGKGVHFICGDALTLPFADQSFDAVVNLEASHCYPDLPAFLRDVRRLLRPGGTFLYADMRKASALNTWRRQLQQSGLILLEEEDITARVLAALERSNDRVSALIQQSAPRWSRRFLSHFAATKGTSVYNQLASGRMRYIRFAFRNSA